MSNYLKKHALKYQGECLAGRTYSFASFNHAKEGGKFRNHMKYEVESAINDLYKNHSKKDSKLIVDGMYNEFGNMGEFLPQLYILNITKPRNIGKKKRDLWKTIEKYKV